MFKKGFFSSAVLAVFLAFGAMTSTAAWAIPQFQLGFALDASGSVSAGNYNLLRSGLNAALAAIPANDTIEITVVSYGSSVTTVVAPTLLNTASLPTIQAAINTHAKDDWSTNTAGAINALTNLMTGSLVFQDPNVTSIINLATDGFPDSQFLAEQAATNAANAGIDALSIEAIGLGVASQFALNNMARIAFPTPVTILPVNATNIPNPLKGSFVIPVSDFNALAPVLKAKVIASVTPPPPPPPPSPVPEPTTLLLLSIGLVGLGYSTARRKAA